MAQVMIPIFKTANSTKKYILDSYMHFPSIYPDIMQSFIEFKIYWTPVMFQAMFQVSWKEELCRYIMPHVYIRRHEIEWIESGIDSALQIKRNQRG